MNSHAHFRNYTERAAAGDPVLPHCLKCSAVFMPPRAACPECGTASPGWIPALGAAGTLYSYTVIGDGDDARIIGLADLDLITDGSKYYAQLQADDLTLLTMGRPVRVGTADLGRGQQVPVLAIQGAGNE
ncbi:zinc ribbon domain-containing protein [Specibacter sp. NPDC078709]|uniref:Zn-ribbon domain-containing OB-fold protein n=1 Tax=Specibacter sp. NPDC078709 TaxID=3154364 RepID=UPI00342AC6C5